MSENRLMDTGGQRSIVRSDAPDDHGSLLTDGASVTADPTERLGGRTAEPLLSSRSSRWPLAVLWLVVGTAVQLVRSPGVPTYRAVFGEDGGIFLTEALAHPSLGTIFTPYQGYLQVASRLVAAAAAALPVRWAAMVLAILPALLVTALSLYGYSASRAVFAQRRSRVALALLIVALPVGYDINASATNLHWYLDFACAWVFLGPQRRWREVVAGGLVAVLAALSDPLVALFLPLVGYRVVQAWRSGKSSDPIGRRLISVRRELAVPLLYCVALLAQAAVVVLRQAPTPFVETHPGELPELYGLRVAGSVLLGDAPLPGLVAHAGAWVAFVAVVGVGVLLLAGLTQRRHLKRLQVGGLLALSLLWLVVPLLLRGTSTLLDVDRIPLPGSRYTVNPILLLASALLLAVEKPATTRRSGRTLGPQLIVGLLLLASIVTGFRLVAQRSNGPAWSDELAAARATCLATNGRPAEPGRSAEYPWGRAPAPDEVLVPVSPRAPAPPWSAAVPCAGIS
jgi:hypothetical protein